MEKRRHNAFEREGGLTCFFDPKQVAVVGSFRENYFGGYVVIKSLLEAGFSGTVYPVNPRYEEVQGIRVYASLKDIPERVDLVLVMINAQSVPQIIEECGELGVKGVVVISDGFAERDARGGRLQDEVVAMARDRGMRIIGPNTAGLLNTANGFNPAAYEAGYYKFRKGPVAIVSQTGMINPQSVPYPEHRFGVSKICDLGNKGDIDECDLLEYLAADDETGVISLYMEGVRDGRRFLQTCRRVTGKKPVLVLKAGRTKAGARATASHTGSMAMDDSVFDAACRQGGLLRIERFNELFILPKIFASQPLPRGNRLGILSITGGVAAMAVDKAAECGLELGGLGPETSGMLEEIFQGLGRMPVDIGPMVAAVEAGFSLYPRILNALMADGGADCLLNLLWANASGNIIAHYLEAYAAVRGRYEKPLVTWVYGPETRLIREVSDHLEDMGFPVFSEPETCVKALGLALRYSKTRGIAADDR